MNLQFDFVCLDINECESPEIYHCYGNCTNTQGGYDCQCPLGFQGNASKLNGCQGKYQIYYSFMFISSVKMLLSFFSRDQLSNFTTGSLVIRPTILAYMAYSCISRHIFDMYSYICLRH
jgi:hypothetical protein